jgi:anti-sigma regulatory factor (Ser/Thr protein kinase)
VGAPRVDDFVLAMNELVGNSLRHGGGAGEVRLWVEADTVLGEVRDHGSLADPLAGRRRPRPEQTGGRGLWIVNQVSDLVQIRSRPGSTVVRVHMAREPRRFGRGLRAGTRDGTGEVTDAQGQP